MTEVSAGGYICLCDSLKPAHILFPNFLQVSCMIVYSICSLILGKTSRRIASDLHMGFASDVISLNLLLTRESRFILKP